MASTSGRKRAQKFPARSLLELCEPRRLLAVTYYVSPSGSDSASGTSPASAFKSIAKVNTLDLNPGDQVLFEGGKTFTGPGSGANVISNPGFESGSLGAWSLDSDQNPGTTTITTSNLHSGSFAARVAGTGFGGKTQDVSAVMKRNTAYVMRFSEKITSGTGSGYGGISFYKGNNEIFKSSFTAYGSSYQEYNKAFVSPADFDYAFVWFYKDAGTSTLYVDDFTITETPQTLIFNAGDSGAPGNPVIIDSYGSGRATISAPTASALVGTDVSNFEIHDLNFVGSWDGLTATGGNVGEGIKIQSWTPGNVKLDHIRIDNVDVSRFKWGGIRVAGNVEKSGFSDVRITNAVAHDNGGVGIDVQGVFDPVSTLYANSGVYIGYCQAYNNGGIPNTGGHSGNGILVGDTDRGTIERCVAWNNGALCNSPSGGPVGIWTWDSNAITIQYNEAYATKTGSGVLDGGGFDLDGGVTNSLVQYNYSHDNYGAGYLLYQFTGARPYGNNVVRYNISQNDARRGHYGGIYLGGGTPMANNQIYNNTLYITPTSDTTIAGIKLTGVGPGNTFRNNIIQTAGGVNLLDINTSYSTSSALFQGNLYYSSGSTFSIKWGSTIYGDLSSWRATGQEKLSGASTGVAANPMLASPGGGGTIGDATRLYTLGAYRLLSGSPAINGGVDLESRFGMDPGPLDFFNNPLPNGANDIGAFEHPQSISSVSGTSSSDTFTVRRNSSGAFEVFVNASTSGPATYVWNSSTPLNISGAAGDDVLVLDFTNGNPIPSAGMSFDGGAHTLGDAITVTGSSASDSVTLTGTTLTPAGGAALSYTGVESITLNLGAGNDTLNFNGPVPAVAFNGGSGANTLNVNSSTFTFNSDASDSTDDLSINVISGASVVFKATQHLAALKLTGTARATMNPSGNHYFQTESLNIGPSARFDLNDNDLIVTYTGPSVFTTIQSYVSGGYSPDVDVARAGLVSSTGQLAGNMILALLDNAMVYANEWPQGSGNLVPAMAVIGKYTYFGDANLDGKVSADDYSVLDAHLGAAPPPGLAWLCGDSNLDGMITADDYGVLDAHFGKH